MWWLTLIACGGAGADEALAAAPAPVDSPFCAAFEACVEGLPGWDAGCDRWWAGDPDCAGLDFSEGPADWYDETRRGISALRHPGADEEDVRLEEKGASAKSEAEKGRRASTKGGKEAARP